MNHGRTVIRNHDKSKNFRKRNVEGQEIRTRGKQVHYPGQTVRRAYRKEVIRERERRDSANPSAMV